MKSLIKKFFLITLVTVFGFNANAAVPGDAYIAWASNEADSASTIPGNEVGSPNLTFTGISDFPYVWVRYFNPKIFYSGLLDLLNSSVPGTPATELLTPEDLANADIIAFEGNGGAGATGGGGWESSTWFFKGLKRAYAETFNELTGKGTILGGRRAKFLTGSIPCDQYVAYFGITGPTCADAGGFSVGVISWILIDVPNDINVHDKNFSVWVSGAGLGVEGTPDPDAIGILSH